jgi:hypothetical protein
MIESATSSERIQEALQVLSPLVPHTSFFRLQVPSLALSLSLFLSLSLSLSLSFSHTLALAPRGIPPLSACRWKMRVDDARSRIEIVDDTLLDAVLA